ncbi:MAG: hypothetical protein ABW189_05950 [Rickettsiales bacterium]
MIRHSFFRYAVAGCLAFHVAGGGAPAYAKNATYVVSPREGYTRIEFKGTGLTLPKASKNGRTLRLSFPSGVSVAGEASYDAGAVARVRPLKGRNGVTAKLRVDEAAIRPFVSENGSGVDVIPCPCDGATPLQDTPPPAAVAKKIRVAPVIVPAAPRVPKKPEEKAAAPKNLTAAWAPDDVLEIEVYEPTAEDDAAESAPPPPPPAPSGAAKPLALAPAAPKVDAAIASPPPSSPVMELAYSPNVSAAFFRRENVYWMIFSDASLQNDEEARKASTALFDDFHRLYHPEYGVYYGRLKKGVETLSAEIRTDGTSGSWIFRAASDNEAAPTSSPSVSLESSALAGSALRVRGVPLINPLRFIDPVVGDELLVMPLYEPKKGTAKAFSYPDFLLLPSLQGVALALRSDRVTYEFDDDAIEVAGPTNRLAASAQSAFLELQAQERKKKLEKAESNADVEKSLIKFKTWKKGGDEKFLPARSALLLAAANAPLAQKSAARLNLARFYVANGLEFEALGVIALLRERDKTFGDSAAVRMPEGVANYMSGRYEEAVESLSKLTEKNFSDAADAREWRFWLNAAKLRQYLHFMPPERYLRPSFSSEEGSDKGGELRKDDEFYADGGESRWSGENGPGAVGDLGLASAMTEFLPFYPPETYNDFVALAIEEMLLKGNVTDAEATFLMINAEEASPGLQYRLDILRGVLAAQENKVEDALAYWKTPLEDADAPFYRTWAGYLTTFVQFRRHLISVDDAIAGYNAIRYSWRGSTLELGVLKALGDLYMQKNDYMHGFGAWREAVTQFEGYDEALLIAKRMTDKFAQIFRSDDKTLSNMDALELFFEFRELIPIGETGDQIVTALADRLIAVDLLDRAAALLTHQVKYRLHGEERENALFKLIDIYMENKRPEKALEAIADLPLDNPSEKAARTLNHYRAKANLDVGRNNAALRLLKSDDSIEASFLRASVFWRNKVWSHVASELEPLFYELRREERPFTAEESRQLIKLAVADALLERRKHLRILQEDFAKLIPDADQRELFDFIAEDDEGIDPDNLTESVGDERMRGFLQKYLTEDKNLTEDKKPAEATTAQPQK